MSKYNVGDEEITRSLLKNPSPVENNQTWLRHKADGESGLIDLMVLEGNNTIDDMVNALSNNPALKPKRDSQWKKRIRDHLIHLSTQEGDSRNIASGQGGHSLNLEEDSAGRICFSNKLT